MVSGTRSVGRSVGRSVIRQLRPLIQWLVAVAGSPSVCGDSSVVADLTALFGGSDSILHALCWKHLSHCRSAYSDFLQNCGAVMLQRVQSVQHYTEGTKTGIVSMLVTLRKVDHPCQQFIQTCNHFISVVHVRSNLDVGGWEYAFVNMEIVFRCLMLES
jgi:hypothetical protein